MKSQGRRNSMGNGGWRQKHSDILGDDWISVAGYRGVAGKTWKGLGYVRASYE